MNEVRQAATARNGLAVNLPHLQSTGRPPERTSLAIYRRLADLDRFGVHRLVDDPEAADVILFTELHLVRDWRQLELRRHPLRSRLPDRCYCFDERSIPWAVLPGLFTSVPAGRLEPRFQIPWGYPGGSEMRTLLAAATPRQADLLFSFTGSPGPRCRELIFALEHPRAVIERVEGFTFFDPGSADFEARRQNFIDLTMRSKFVLCPRGLATSSIRLYETLAAGRVPVILSDHWLAPVGPHWDRFSVRWPEAEVASIPRHLEAIEDRWEEMASAARQAYDDWFANDATFHRTIEALRPLLERDAAAHFPPTGLRNRQFLAAGTRRARGRLHMQAVGIRNRLRSLAR